MNTEILPYRRLPGMARSFEKTKGLNFIIELITNKCSLMLPVAFLLGRVSLLGGIMPFGIAAFAAGQGLEVNKVLLAVAILIGMVSGGAGEQLYITIAAILLYSAVGLVTKSKSKSTLRSAITAFISIIIPSVVMVYLQGFLLYDMLKAVFQASIAFTTVFIFNKGISILGSQTKKFSFTNEEVISIAILAALSLSGLSGAAVFGFTLKNISCILIILVLSFKGGAGIGAATGVTIGLITSMSSTVSPLVVGTYAFCGLLAGVFRGLGKLGSCLGFVLGNALLTFYMNGSTDILMYLKDIIFAVVVFMLVPQKLIELAAFSLGGSSGVQPDSKTYGAHIKEMTVGKLKKYSNAFKEMSRTFSEISETKTAINKQDISSLFDRVADNVCKDCSLCLHCWDRNFYSTYQVMFKIVEKLDIKGRIEPDDVPGYFMERCERINDFVLSVNNVYEVFKVGIVWKNRIEESRGLVSQQLDGLSKVISNLASELDADVEFKGELEGVILAELNTAGIKVHEVIVLENKAGKFEVCISHKGCGGKRNCISIIEKIASRIVGRKMIKENSDCCGSFQKNLCSIKLVEDEVFRVTTGVAKVSKHEVDVSGDSYTFLNNGEGKYIVSLSDGMGSGQKAATQSKAAINLIEQFMESGFDKDTTVKLINSMLVLKSSDDSFATIDMTVVDLYNGEVEFVKVGAVPTFIKKNEKVETVKSVSLPAGLMSNVELELVHKKIDSGDFIIMLTDGVIDAFKKDGENEKTIQKLIQGIKTTNSQEIADYILDKAYQNCEGKPVDDMTVVVAKVWKRAA